MELFMNWVGPWERKRTKFLEITCLPGTEQKSLTEGLVTIHGSQTGIFPVRLKCMCGEWAVFNTKDDLPNVNTPCRVCDTYLIWFDHFTLH